MIKHVLTAAVLAAAAAATLAAEARPFFVGADMGATKFDGVSGRSTSYGAFAGYQFNQYVGAELGYRRLGDVHLVNRAGSGDLSQAAISVIGTLPLGQGFGIIGRYGRTQIRYHGENLSDGGNGALFGLGVQYAATALVAVRLEAQKPAAGINNLSASLLFSF